LSNRMRKTLAFSELFYGCDKTQINLVGLSNGFRGHPVIEVVQHCLNRHTRRVAENGQAVQVPGICHREIESGPVHVAASKPILASKRVAASVVFWNSTRLVAIDGDEDVALDPFA